MRTQLRVKAAIAALAATCAGLVAGAGPANASAYYAIYNYGSNLCLGIVASNGNAGQYDCTGNNDQQWTLVNQGATYEIKNKNGDCLYVEGLSEQNGAQLKADASHCNQTWQIGEWSFPESSFAKTLNAFYTNSPWVAGILGGSDSSGAHAVIWQHQNNPPQENQYWVSGLW